MHCASFIKLRYSAQICTAWSRWCCDTQSNAQCTTDRETVLLNCARGLDQGLAMSQHFIPNVRPLHCGYATAQTSDCAAAVGGKYGVIGACHHCKQRNKTN